MERYWIPSSIESAVFGTKITDRYFQIGTGGDIGFLSGALKHMIEQHWIDSNFVSQHTAGFDELAADLAAADWETLEALSATSREEMLEFARMVGAGAGAPSSSGRWG